jgi:hypothetical protein
MAYKNSALETIWTALGTELNSLADNAATALSVEEDNSASGQRWPMAMVEILIAAQGTARAAGASVSLFVVPSTDGTNYGDAATEATLNNYLVGVYSLDAATTARYLTGRIVLPPTKYKVALRNNTGQAFAASGNTVKIREFTGEDV